MFEEAPDDGANWGETIDMEQKLYKTDHESSSSSDEEEEKKKKEQKTKKGDRTHLNVSIIIPYVQESTHCFKIEIIDQGDNRMLNQTGGNCQHMKNFPTNIRRRRIFLIFCETLFYIKF